MFNSISNLLVGPKLEKGNIHQRSIHLAALALDIIATTGLLLLSFSNQIPFTAFQHLQLSPAVQHILLGAGISYAAFTFSRILLNVKHELFPRKFLF